MNKKVLISLIVLVLLCGGIYFVYTKVKTNKVVDENIKSPTYNETKTLNIDGVDYRVGLKKYGKNYKLDKIPPEGTGVIELYLNDKKVKTITYRIDALDPGDAIIKIEPHKFSDKYILISIMYSDGIKVCYNNFYVFNLSGEFIGETTWNGYYGIKELSTGNILTYEINDDNLIIYTNNPVTKVRYTIKDNEISKEIIKIYSNDEIELINK